MNRTPALTKNDEPPDYLPEPLWRYLAAVTDRVEHCDGGTHREGQLLYWSRSRLLQVIGADVDRIPLGQVHDRVRDHIGGQAASSARAGRRRCPRGQVFLDDVVLDGAGEELRLGALFLGHDLIERKQPHCGGVDGHRGVHVGQRQTIEQPPHLAQVRDRHPDLADLAASQRRVRVVAGLGRKVEGDRQSGLALGEIASEELVGICRRTVSGIRSHHPRVITARILRIGHVWSVGPLGAPGTAV